MAASVTAPFSARHAQRSSASRAVPHPLASVGFDWAITLAGAWFLGGLYLDGWAHNNIPSLETFFTPWHGVFYSGFLVTIAILGWGIGRNRAPGSGWWDAVPAGYELSLIGALLFAVSGVGDMLWHIAFGIEANVDALLSPTHLSLLLGGALVTSGPIRAAARRRAAGMVATDWSSGMPRMLALTFVLLGLSFFTQYANLWGGPWLASTYQPLTPRVITAGGPALESDFLFQALNVAGVLVQSVLLAGFALAAVRGARVPAGGFALMIGLYGVLMVAMRQKYDAGLQLPLVVAALVGGLVLELVYGRLRSGLGSMQTVRAFVALVPAVATAASIVAVAAAQGTWWTIHLWAGVVVIAAATGWLVAFLASSTTSSTDATGAQA